MRRSRVQETKDELKKFTYISMDPKTNMMAALLENIAISIAMIVDRLYDFET